MDWRGGVKVRPRLYGRAELAQVFDESVIEMATGLADGLIFLLIRGCSWKERSPSSCMGI
jgi:hypothetical protein